MGFYDDDADDEPRDRNDPGDWLDVDRLPTFHDSAAGMNYSLWILAPYGGGLQTGPRRLEACSLRLSCNVWGLGGGDAVIHGQSWGSLGEFLGSPAFADLRLAAIEDAIRRAEEGVARVTRNIAKVRVDIARERDGD